MNINGHIYGAPGLFDDDHMSGYAIYNTNLDQWYCLENKPSVIDDVGVWDDDLQSVFDEAAIYKADFKMYFMKKGFVLKHLQIVPVVYSHSYETLRNVFHEVQFDEAFPMNEL